MNVEHNRRILLVDDMPAIHEDFRKILLMPAACGLDQMEAALFGSSAEQPAPSTLPGFMLDSAYQGQEAVAMVCASLDTVAARSSSGARPGIASGEPISLRTRRPVQPRAGMS